MGQRRAQCCEAHHVYPTYLCHTYIHTHMGMGTTITTHTMLLHSGAGTTDMGMDIDSNHIDETEAEVEMDCLTSHAPSSATSPPPWKHELKSLVRICVISLACNIHIHVGAVVGIDPGTTNPCISVIEGKTSCVVNHHPSSCP